MERPMTVGYLLWRLTTRLRAAVDRLLAPLGLTHAQYTLLASLYGFLRTNVQPTQRQLADWTGLEPIFVSKLARALERGGLIERAQHPSDTRAVQVRLTRHGTQVAEQAIAIVRDFHDEFTAPIGGTQSPPTRALVRTLETLLYSESRSEHMSAAPVLTGQDVGEAEGALTGLLERVLAAAGTEINRTEYIVVRVLAARGEADAGLADYLASQPQLGLSADQAVELLGGLQARGLISAEPWQLTPLGTSTYARLTEAVAGATRRLYEDLDPEQLAVARTVLNELTQRAHRLRQELQPDLKSPS